jgi:hypothetical protein
MAKQERKRSNSKGTSRKPMQQPMATQDEPIEYELLDALELYAQVMNEILAEMGVDSREYSREQLHELARAGFAEFNGIYNDFILWVLYGNDKRAKTMAMVRAAKNGGRLF